MWNEIQRLRQALLFPEVVSEIDRMIESCEEDFADENNRKNLAMVAFIQGELKGLHYARNLVNMSKAKK